MKFSTSATAFFLFALVVASPMPKEEKDSSKAKSDSDSDSKSSAKGQTSAAAAGGASVLSSQNYNDFQVSDGKTGTAKADVAKIFADIDMNNLASVTADDLKKIKNVHDVAEDAEVNAFNPAIEKATGAEAEALQNGKIANKVLKTTATVLALNVEAAQGKENKAKLDQEVTKMNKNIQLNEKNPGQAMQSVKLDEST